MFFRKLPSRIKHPARIRRWRAAHDLPVWRTSHGLVVDARRLTSVQAITRFAIPQFRSSRFAIPQFRSSSFTILILFHLLITIEKTGFNSFAMLSWCPKAISKLQSNNIALRSREPLVAGTSQWSLSSSHYMSSEYDYSDLSIHELPLPRYGVRIPQEHLVQRQEYRRIRRQASYVQTATSAR